MSEMKKASKLENELSEHCKECPSNEIGCIAINGFECANVIEETTHRLEHEQLVYGHSQETQGKLDKLKEIKTLRGAEEHNITLVRTQEKLNATIQAMTPRD